jgi:hypothetical protein
MLPAEIIVRQTRTFDDCRTELVELPSSLVVVEATAAGLDRCLQLLSFVVGGFPLARSVVVAARQLEPFEQWLRESGALHVTFGMRTLHQVAALANRQARYFKQPTTLRDEIWQRLPWSAE